MANNNKYKVIPEEYLKVICDKMSLSSEKDIIDAQQLGDGKSGAYVYRIKILGTHMGYYIVKCVDRNGRYYDEKADEAAKYKELTLNAGNFKNRLVELVAVGLTDNDWLVMIYNYALFSLNNAVSIDVMEKNQFPEYLRQLSFELLELWNPKCTYHEGVTDFFENILSYRMGVDGSFMKKEMPGLNRHVAALPVGSSLYPNPFYYIIEHRDRWEDKISSCVFQKGNSHGDLHAKNILCNKSTKSVEYAIIDFDSYRKDTYLFFDNAYLELSLYLFAEEQLDSESWIKQVEPYIKGSIYEDVEEKNNLDFQLIRNSICGGIKQWIEADTSRNGMKDDVEIQFRMARIAAGINFFSKNAINSVEMLTKLLHYIGLNLRCLFKTIGFQEWPRDNDIAKIHSGDEQTKGLPNEMVVSTLQKESKEPQSYKKAMEAVYGLLITDISGVLFDYSEDGREEFPDGIVDVFARLAKRHVSICFTTGRGRTGARQLLLQLAQKIIAKDDSISLEDLARDWVCITHNGAYLLTTSMSNKSGFLANDEELLKDTIVGMRHMRDSARRINEAYNSIIKREVTEYYARVGDTGNKCSVKGTATIEPVSVRFTLEDCPTDEVRDSIFDKAIEYLFKIYSSVQNNVWHKTIGKYENKVVLNYSLANKSDAVNAYISRFKPIDSRNILRMADSGQEGGSDYSFLADGISFSVGDISTDLKTKGTCFPVLDETGKTLRGVEATIHLLNRLHFYPALCFKNVHDISSYRSSFANSLMGTQKKKKEVLDFYNSRLSWIEFLYELDYPSDRISKVFDSKSGAISFSDLEWNRIESILNSDGGSLSNAEKQVKNFEGMLNKTVTENSDKCKPNLTYFMHTDTHVLFRGWLYYYYLYASRLRFMGADSVPREEWNNIFSDWIGLVKQFISDYKKALGGFSTSQEDTSQPVNYLARKLILGGLDNVRNIILLLEVFWIRMGIANQQEEGVDSLICIPSSGGGECASRLSELLSRCLSAMYDALFYPQIYFSFAEDITTSILPELGKIVGEIARKSSDFILNEDIEPSYIIESFPRWRENDCLIENIATIDLFLSTVLDKWNPLSFWGITYGSLEHPVLANVLCEKRGIKHVNHTHFIYLHGKYEDRHEEQFEVVLSKAITPDQDAKNILIDDTITSGKTLDLCVKLLSLADVSIDSIVVVRYAGINRLNHYLTHTVSEERGQGLSLQASAPDVSRFNNLIYGLLSEAPYTKLFKYGINAEKPYENVKGIFDKAKNRIKEYLSVNYDYEEMEQDVESL